MEDKKIEEKNIVSVPFIAFESVVNRAESRAKRLHGIIAMLVFMLVLTNGLWLFYEASCPFSHNNIITTDESITLIESSGSAHIR